MPNTIKYSTSGDTQSLKKGNFFIGVGDVPKGPSSRTNHWQGITPPTSGYTIYINSGSGSTAIMVPDSDAKLVEYANGMNNNTNLFPNGGNFADGTGSPFVLNSYGGTSTIINISNDKPYPGSSSKYALQITNGGNYMSTANLLTVGQTYTFSFWARKTDGTSGNVGNDKGPIWNNQNGSGELNSFSYPWYGTVLPTTTIDGTWRKYNFTFTYNAARIYFYFYGVVGTSIFTEFQIMTGSTYGGPGLQNATEALNWFSSVSQDEVCVNRDYESITTNGLILNLDAGYTPSYPRTGSVWYDMSYSGLNGTLTNGPTYNSSNGGSISFDGVDDRWSVSNITPGTSAFTIECFFKYKSHSLYLPTILGAGDYWQGGNQVYWGFGQNGGQAGYYFQLRNNESKNATVLNYTMVDDTIYHFVGTRTISGNQQIIKSYKNGSLVETSSPTSIYDLSSMTTLTNKQYVHTGPPPANIYNIRVYGRDLSSSEILQNYQSQFPRFLGENIVTSGLSLYLDAGYRPSYPSSGTTWNNMSGLSGGTGTLINGPTYSSSNGGYITFDGSDDYANLGDFSYNRTYFSVFIWLNFPTYHAGWDGGTINKWYVGGSNGTGNEWSIGPNNVNGPCPFGVTVQYGPGGSSTISVDDNVNYATNTWYYLGFTWNSGTLKLYVNGVERGSATTANTTAQTTTQPLAIATFYNFTQYMTNLKVGVAKIYNRTISGTEITQNFNAQKSRYGL
jgi:hypothetical protein